MSSSARWYQVMALACGLLFVSAVAAMSLGPPTLLQHLAKETGLAAAVDRVFPANPKAAFLSSTKASPERVDEPQSSGPALGFPLSGRAIRQVSHKRGIAIQNMFLNSNIDRKLQNLAGMVSWAYGWDVTPWSREGGPTLNQWANAGILWFPMARSMGQVSAGFPSGAKAILGFNEPNFAGSNFIEPVQAASLWRDHLEPGARAAGISAFVSPAVNGPGSGGVQADSWLDGFFGACGGHCKVDAIAVHIYACDLDNFQNQLNQYKKYGKQIWVTEFACQTWNGQFYDMSQQMSYMQKVVPILEQESLVQRYAWFSYDQAMKNTPPNNEPNWKADAKLFDPNNGDLTDLGKLYMSL